MAIVYRTDGAWGTGQGSNLAPAQVDGNFWDIDSRVTYIEDNPVLPIEPISITIAGYNFSMGLSNGETLGPVTMTMPVPEWRGEWTPDTIYHDMDFITAPDGGFGAVMLGHTSAATFDWAATSTDGLPLYRQIVGSNAMTVALSDLTDVALSGLATGDMLAWDAAASYWRNLDPAEIAGQLVVFQGDTGSGGTQGVVPAPASGDAAAHKFLSASGTWVVPETGSGGSASLAGLTDVSISSPVDNSLLQYKSGDGKWHNSSLVDLGAGTVTSVTAGTGLSGGTITHTGTVALAAAPTATLLANTAGGSAPPAPVSLTVALDALAGSTRGGLLQRNAVGWQPLAPGTAGLFLRTGGSGADLTWASPAGNGTVTSITAGAGLSGGTITTSGTVALAAIADDLLLANVSGASAPPTATSVTALLDAALGTTRGSVIRRDGSAWTALAPGTAGHVLTSGGSGADVSWAPGGGSGAGVSVGDAPPASPNPGDLWFDSASANLFIRYQDLNSTAWIAAVNQPGPQGATGATGPAGPAGATGATGPAGSANMTGMTAGQIPIAASATTVTSSGNLSGDVTTAGSLATTLATVNANTGVFQGLTLDGKGRVTAASNQGYLTTATAASTYAPLASPTFTGTPSLPTGTTGVTQAVATNSTALATTAYVVRDFVAKSGGTMTGGLSGTTASFSSTLAASGTVTFSGGNVYLGPGASGVQGTLLADSQSLYFALPASTGIIQFRNANSAAYASLAYIDNLGNLVITGGSAIKAGGGSWSAPSSRELKEDIVEYDRGLDAVLQLNPVVYSYNGKGGLPTGTRYAGLIADEVEPVMPEMVGEATIDKMTVPTIDNSSLIYALVNAIKELSAKVAALEAAK